jgi:hypothetical protein
MLVMATAAFALQTPLDARLDDQLRQLFPAATSFSAKNGTPAARVSGPPKGGHYGSHACDRNATI